MIDGARAERIAARHLQRRGWRLLHRNWRGGGGELDLVVARRGSLVFVEVKARTDDTALDAPVGWTQLGRIHRAAAAYLARYPWDRWVEVRIDLVTVHRTRWRTVVRHRRNALVSPELTPR